eukprot:Nk52_evm83s914 gene=Nk52_evmTU83s914
MPNESSLDHFLVGECIGKGGFGCVYKGLNTLNGTVVAIKKVKTSQMSRSAQSAMMMEIDLLKKLNHPNIVKYIGFVKTRDHLNIILEYIENGSLHNICKKFGQFPETLIAVYIKQTLGGLVYLHEQGVVHRDIKGANILTTKEGHVKLADFGVAVQMADSQENDVVGTPYWMAPEIIELNGASTASDIWSLGCTVIELLSGHPPYYEFAPMPALFRIVQDDHPPIPEGSSGALKDFLLQCFQKDPNLRVSAKKLLKHPWLNKGEKNKPIDRWDKALNTIKQFNTALKSNSHKGNESYVAHTLDLSGKKRSISRGSVQELFKSSTLTSAKDDFSSPNSDSSVSQLPGCENVGDPEVKKGTSFSPSSSRASNGSFRRSSSEKSRYPEELGILKPKIAFQKEDTNSFPNEEDYVTAETSKGSNIVHTSETVVVRQENEKVETNYESDEENWDDAFEGDLDISTINSNVQSIRISNVNVPMFTSDSGPEVSAATATPPPPLKAPSSKFEPEYENDDWEDDFPDVNFETLSKTGKVSKVSVSSTEGPNINHVAEALAVKYGDSGDFMDDLDIDESAIEKLQRFSSTQTIEKVPAEVQTKVDKGISLPKYEDPSIPDDENELLKTAAQPPVLALSRFEEKKGDDDDFSDILNQLGTQESKGLALKIKPVGNEAWKGFDEDSDEEDPFADLEDDFDEYNENKRILENNKAKKSAEIRRLISSLSPGQRESELLGICEALVAIFTEYPELKVEIITHHGVIPILELLDVSKRSPVLLTVLRVINFVMEGSFEIQENFCMVGGIPAVMKFAAPKYTIDVRKEAALFIRQMCRTSSTTLQMFIACRGLKVLVDFLEENHRLFQELIFIAIEDIWNVFEFQTSTPKNDFCRIFTKNGLLSRLSITLHNLVNNDTEPNYHYIERIASLLLYFSHADSYVKMEMAKSPVIKRILSVIPKLPVEILVKLLKGIKNLTMDPNTLENLHQAHVIPKLVAFLERKNGPCVTEMHNQILNSLFNLCRINKTRQEEAASCGIIPHLKYFVSINSPLKQFALPIVCDLAYTSRRTRTELRKHKGIELLLSLLKDPYWQVNALDALAAWLKDDTNRVEETLSQSVNIEKIVVLYGKASSPSFDNLQEPLRKILYASDKVNKALGRSHFIPVLVNRLQHPKANVRVSMLLILTSLFEIYRHPEEMVKKYNLESTIQTLKEDPAILVQEMATKLISMIKKGSKGSSRFRL